MIQQNLKTVYHYCSVNTFYSIISSQTLRLSDITKSNDKLEVAWVKGKLGGIFDKAYDILNEEVKSTISKEDYRKKIREKEALYFEGNELSDKFFVICFAGRDSGDLLSQWRGYGDDGRGVSIGFNEKILERSADSYNLYSEKSHRIFFRKVEYDVRQQTKRILTVIEPYLKRMNEEDKYEIRDIRSQFEITIMECFTHLYHEAIFMKNPFFKEEDESRFVISMAEDQSGIKDKELKSGAIIKNKEFYVREDEIVSYYEIDFAKIKKDKKGFINKVILGPKCNADQGIMSSFMKSKGYYVSKPEFIEISKGSYR